MGSFSSKCRLRMATFSFGAYCFRCFFMRSLHYLNGRMPSPFPTEPEQCSLQHDFFSGLQVALEETRAWANYEVLGSLHDREENDWGRFGRLRRQLETKYEYPNDILVEAARLPKPRQKSAGSKRLERR